MPRYDYRANDSDGKTVSGIIEAPTVELATDTLKDKGLNIVSIQESAKKSILELDLPFIGQVGVRDLVIFSRQFSVLMGAKVPIVSSLRTVAKQTMNKKLREMLLDIADETESGMSLSIGMAKYPKVFTGFFVNMIKSGETTGRLEDVMNYLADQMERDFDLTAKIKGAMIYPIVVIFGLVVVGFIMMAYVVPKLTTVMKESGTKLPWTTQGLIFVSDFTNHNAPSIIVFGILVTVGMRWWTNTPSGRKIWDNVILRAPVFGPMLQLIYLVRFTRSLSTLISGGVDIPGSLEVCADIVGNARYKEKILQTKKEVMDGNSITVVFEQDPTIPKMVPQMMSVGEESGRLSEVLEKLTSFYTRELENKVANLVHAIEPMIMLVMGGAVGVMVAAIMMPMYSMATSM